MAIRRVVIGPLTFLRQLSPRSLYARSLTILITPLLLLQGISAWIFYDRHWDRITWEMARAVAGDIAHVVAQLQEEPERTPIILERAHAFLNLDVALAPSTPIVADPTPRLEGQALTRALRETWGATKMRYPVQVLRTEGARDISIAIQLPQGDAVFTIPEKRLSSPTTLIFLLWMWSASLILFAVASVFMRNQMRPIRKLAQVMDAFGKGRDHGGALRPEGAAEVRQASAAFNRMRRRLHRQNRQRTDMLAAVSHDLRTPLTRIRLHLALQDNSAEAAAIQENIAEMERMINGYLAFARGEGDETTQPTDLSELAAATVAAWQESGAPVRRHTAGPLILPLRRAAVRRCLDNLIANACRYGATVDVTVRRTNSGDVEAIVDDDGPGIPEDDRGKALQPFVRLDPSRNARTGGSGLGLSIARDIARAHGGDLTLEEAPGGGLRARVFLPV